MGLSLKKQMLWNAAGNVVYLACQWFITVLVTRMGGFGDAGLLSVAMSFSAVFQTIAMFGIRNYQVSDLAGEYSDTQYVAFRVLTCSLAMASCMAAALVMRYWSLQLLAVFLFMLFRLAEAFADVLHGIAQKNGRLDLAGKSFAVKGVGLLAAFWLAYRFSGDLCLALFCMTAFTVVETATFDRIAARRLSRFSAFAPLRGVLPMAIHTLPLCGYLFLHSALSTVPKLVLEKMEGEEILGAYSAVFAPALLISAAAIYLYQPFIASFTGWHRGGERRRFLSGTALFLGVIAGLSVLVLAAAKLFGVPVLSFIFGEEIREYGDLLLPVLVGIVGVAVLSFLETLEIILRDLVWLLIGCGAGLLAEVVSSVVLIRRVGANGASYSIIIATALAAVILLIRVVCLAGKSGELTNE